MTAARRSNVITAAIFFAALLVFTLVFARLAGVARMADPGGCAAYAAAATKRLDDRLAKEAAAK